MNATDPKPLNEPLQRDVSRLMDVTEKLHRFCAQLSDAGAILPPHLYLRVHTAEIVFTKPAKDRLARIFGRDGWHRESSDRAQFYDWVKVTEGQVSIRIAECETVASPLSEVPADLFDSGESELAAG